MMGFFFFYFGNVVHEVSEKCKRETALKTELFEKGLHNASLVL